MEQLTENDIKPITTPADAIDQFVGEQFIEWLLEYVAHEVKSWPQLQDLKNKEVKPEKIKKFMLQRYLAAEAFTGGRENEPGFLGFAIANLSESADPEAESALEILEKKLEEEFEGLSSSRGIKKDQHQQSWLKLLKALGVSDEEIKRAEPKEWTRNYIAELSDLYSNGEWQEVVGAFASHERMVPEENNVLIQMLRKTGLTDHDLEVLIWHAGSDIKYVINTGHILEKVVFDKDNKQLVWQGVTRHLQIRKDFFNSLIQHLEN